MKARVGHIATTWWGHAYAIAAFDTRIEIWDTRTLHRNAAFDTCYDYGGARVAIAPNGDAVLVGSYRRRLVALYDAAKGAVRWTCTKLGHVHSVAFDPVNGDILVRAGDAGAMHIDPVNGELVNQYRNALRFEVSPLHEGFGLCEFSKFLSLSARVSGKRLWDV